MRGLTRSWDEALRVRSTREPAGDPGGACAAPEDTAEVVRGDWCGRLARGRLAPERVGQRVFLGSTADPHARGAPEKPTQPIDSTGGERCLGPARAGACGGGGKRARRDEADPLLLAGDVGRCA